MIKWLNKIVCKIKNFRFDFTCIEKNSDTTSENKITKEKLCKYCIEPKKLYELGKSGNFELCQLNRSNSLEISRGLLYSLRKKESVTDTIKSKAKELLDKYYVDHKLFPQDDEFIQIIKEFEKLLEPIDADISDYESFLHNIHLHQFEDIKKDTKLIDGLIEFIDNEPKNSDKLVILVEKLLSYLNLSYLNNEKNNDNRETIDSFLNKIYDACERKEDWRLIGVFAFILDKLPESIKHKLTNNNDPDIKKFIENNDANKNFYKKYSLNLDTLLLIAKGIALEKESESITLTHIDTAIQLLYFDKDFKNEKIKALCKVVSKIDNNGDATKAEKYLDKALGVEDKITFDKYVKIFKSLFESYLGNEKNIKIFGYEKLAETSSKDDNIYYDVLKEFADKLYQEKEYSTALIYFEKFRGEDKNKDENIFKILVCAAKTSQLISKYENIYNSFKEKITTKCEEIEKLKAENDSEEFKKYFIVPCQYKQFQQLIDAGKYQTILLLAKYEAIQQSAEKITIEHIKEATQYLCIKESAKTILDEFKITESTDKVESNEEMFKDALFKEKLDYDETTKELVAKFKEDKEAEYFILFRQDTRHASEETIEESVETKSDEIENIQEDSADKKELTGNDLLLLSKAFAIQDNSNVIEIKHLYRALGAVEIIDENLARVLPKDLDIESGTEYDTMIERANKNPKMHPNESLKVDKIFEYIKNNKGKVLARARK